MKKNLRWIIEILILIITLITVSLLILMGKIGIMGFIITLIISYILNIVLSIYIFTHERNFETKISWLLFIILIPIIGHITFLFLGRKNILQISKKEYEKEFQKFANPKIKSVNSMSVKNYSENKISTVTQRKWKPAFFKIYKHGFESYKFLFKDIEAAKHHIHIQMYIVKPSETFDQFKALLIKKVNQGVEVRILLDDFGKWSFDDYEIKDMTKQGIQIKIFNKITFPFINIKQSFRLHRKMIIIDGNITHTGGMNISDEYSSFDKKYGYWVDINARVTGEISNDFSQLFLFNWFQISQENLDIEKYIIKQKISNTNSKTLMFEEGPNVSEYILEKTLINTISFANKKIRIATPYFVPSKKIIEQFKFALLEGVEVEIFIPGKADKKYILEATHLFLNELILLGAKVYVLKDMFLHSKIGTFDNSYGYLGTINWDMRTFYSNYELLNFVSGDVVLELDAIFDEYKIYSTILLPKIKKSKSPIKIVKFFLIRIFAPLM